MTTTTKKLYSGYNEVTTSIYTDKIPTLQNGENEVTTVQKIYNLFKAAYDSIYTTTQDVEFIVSNALTDFATLEKLNEGLDLKINKQSANLTNIDASIIDDLQSNNCILSITNISSGSGNKLISINCENILTDGDTLTLQLIYKGFDVNLRSYFIEDNKLFIYLNVHSSPTEPILISLNKTN